MTWHYEVNTGIHTRHPMPAGPYDPFGVLNLTGSQLRRETATHEAGHAMTLLDIGIPFGEIVIADDPADDSAVHGIQIPEAGPTPPAVAVSLAAGERAADRWLREHGLWTPDRAWAVEIIAHGDRAQLDTRFPGHDLAALHDKADRALDRLWPGVLRLGEALDRHGRLDYAQAVEYAAIPCGR